MRRWLPWTIASVLLLALGFALTLVPPAPPYEFLRGRTGMEMKFPPQDVSLHGNLADSAVLYTFKGDYDEVVMRAHRELSKKGLRGFDSFGGCTYVTVRNSPGASQWIPRVTLYRDARAHDATESQPSGKPFAVTTLEFSQPGWITVLVEGAEKPSWFDSFRSWIGL